MSGAVSPLRGSLRKEQQVCGSAECSFSQQSLG